jgi:ABC-type antimicrobial peptide transport system permease subunit
VNDGDGTAFFPFTSQELARAPYVVFRPGRESISLDQVRAAVHRASPGVRVAISRSRMFEGTREHPRFLATLLGALSLVTIALTIVGIFGIVNHAVARRTREVGIRMALGADAARIRRLVLVRALVPAAAGVAIGVLASLWWTPSLHTLLYGLQSHDVASFTLSAALVLVTVAVAGFVPAWRASRLAPKEALRAE